MEGKVETSVSFHAKEHGCIQVVQMDGERPYLYFLMGWDVPNGKMQKVVRMYFDGEVKDDDNHFWVDEPKGCENCGEAV